ncbi:hypothetical protein LB505_009271 [Fusarium chuoi]|nr:hypothetical protein LB505_009271 [Fusarium chuoi]
MAMKNATVPPNMHFETLNPDIEPFYRNLEVPTSAKAWPDALVAPMLMRFWRATSLLFITRP